MQHLKITWILTCILTSFTVTQAKLGFVLGSQQNTRIHVVFLQYSKNALYHISNRNVCAGHIRELLNLPLLLAGKTWGLPLQSLSQCFHLCQLLYHLLLPNYKRKINDKLKPLVKNPSAVTREKRINN